MKKLAVSIIVLTLIVAGGISLPAKAGNSRDLAAYINALIPSGEVSINLMEIGLSPTDSARYTELNNKIKKSVAEHQEWFQKFLQENVDVSPLPYHENLGLTEDEYKEILTLNDKAKMHKKSDGKIQIVKDGTKIRITGIAGVNVLTNLVIDLANNTIETQYGICKSTGALVMFDEQSPTGPWSGYVWNLPKSETKPATSPNQPTTQVLTSIAVYIGQLDQTKETIIYVDTKITENQTSTKKYEIITFSCQNSI